MSNMDTLAEDIETLTEIGSKLADCIRVIYARQRTYEDKIGKLEREVYELKSRIENEF